MDCDGECASDSSYDTDNESVITVIACSCANVREREGGRIDVTSAFDACGTNVNEQTGTANSHTSASVLCSLPNIVTTTTCVVSIEKCELEHTAGALVTVNVVSTGYPEGSRVVPPAGNTFVLCSTSTASSAAMANVCGSGVESSKERCLPQMERSKFVNPEMPGYVGFANLPNQVHRKSVKKGFEFTLLVVGESGLGKSTLVNSLFLTDLYPDRKIANANERIEKTVAIETSTVEIEERGVKLRLTVVDTPGYADGINNKDSFKEIIKYIDSQFEKYLQDESGLNRRHIIDNRVHCCFYFINPAGHGLKPLDIAFMKEIDHKVNIVPVIAKADTLTKAECQKMKKRVMEQVQQNGIQVYTLPECDDDEDEEYKEQCRQLKEAAPFAVCGSTQVLEVRGKKVRGRMYPWGIVEVENPDHCDFIKLRTMLITHMQDLQEVTQDVHYENFRSERLSKSGIRKTNIQNRASVIESEHDKLTEKERQLAEKEAELKRMQEMLSKLQLEVQRPSAVNGHSVSTTVNGSGGMK